MCWCSLWAVLQLLCWVMLQYPSHLFIICFTASLALVQLLCLVCLGCWSCCFCLSLVLVDNGCCSLGGVFCPYTSLLRLLLEMWWCGVGFVFRSWASVGVLCSGFVRSGFCAGGSVGLAGPCWSFCCSVWLWLCFLLDSWLDLSPLLHCLHHWSGYHADANLPWDLWLLEKYKMLNICRWGLTSPGAYITPFLMILSKLYLLWHVGSFPFMNIMHSHSVLGRSFFWYRIIISIISAETGLVSGAYHQLISLEDLSKSVVLLAFFFLQSYFLTGTFVVPILLWPVEMSYSISNSGLRTFSFTSLQLVFFPFRPFLVYFGCVCPWALFVFRWVEISLGLIVALCAVAGDLSH